MFVNECTWLHFCMLERTYPYSGNAPKQSLTQSAVVAVTVVYATKEVVEEDETTAQVSDPFGIKPYIQANVLQRNTTWHQMAKDDPRQLAVDWILHTDKMQLVTLGERLSQRYILALLAFSFDSSTWAHCGNPIARDRQADGEHDTDSCLIADDSGYETEHSAWLSKEHECDWYRVMCVDDRVSGLDMSEFSQPAFFPIAYQILLYFLVTSLIC